MKFISGMDRSSSNRIKIELTKNCWYISKEINHKRFNVICSAGFIQAFVHKNKKPVALFNKEIFNNNFK